MLIHQSIRTGAAVIALLLLTGGERAAGQAQPEACQVRDMRLVRQNGPGLDWSTTEDLILVAEPDEQKNIQVHIIRPDGSRVRCLTCKQVPGGPPVNVHKGVPHWHPSGKYIFLQVEAVKHPGKRELAQPGSGRNNDIWATTPDGDRWWQLTNKGGEREAGILFPVPSPDGRKLAWAERFAGPRRPLATLLKLRSGRGIADAWGRWRINVADIDYSSGGPRLTNIKSHVPGDAQFFEMQVWSPNSEEILFASNMKQDTPFILNIHAMNVSTGRLRPVVTADEEWLEHIAYSPSGRKLAYMSSECCDYNPRDLKTLVADLYLMNADGSGKVRLTHFNAPGYPESSKSPSIVAKATWSPDGRRLALARILVAGFTGEDRPTELWMLNFAGPCGLR